MEYRLSLSARLAGETANVFPEFGIMLKDLPSRAKRLVGEYGCLEFRVERLNHDHSADTPSRATGIA